MNLRAETGPMVWAYYHSWWGTPDGPSGRWVGWHCPMFPPGQALFVDRAATGEDTPVLEHDPERFLWADVRDLGIASYPLDGPYDSTDPAVVWRQVRQAREAGLDGFVHDWLGGRWGAFEDPRTWENDQSDRNLSVLLDVVERDEPGFGVMALLDVHYMRRYSVEETVAEYSGFYDRHATRPGYLKVHGRPLAAVFRAADHHSPDDWRRIRAELERRGKSMWLFCDDLADEDVFDGLCLYAYLGLSEARDEGAYLAEAVERATSRARELGRSLIAPVMPGFDSRSYIHPGSWGFVVPRRDGEHYEQSWRAWSASGAAWIAVNSWNEWYERSNIEPDREFGDRFVQLTKRHADAFRR
jgi:hypothetical protein